MLQSPLLHDGLALTAYGMGVVFVFLTLLFLATALMSACARAFFPAAGADRAAAAATEPAARRRIAAVAAAVRRYRRRSSA